MLGKLLLNYNTRYPEHSFSRSLKEKMESF